MGRLFLGESKAEGQFKPQVGFSGNLHQKAEKVGDTGHAAEPGGVRGRINTDVTIKSFTYEPFGGGGDYAYSITFVQYRALKIYTTDELGLGKKKKKKKKKSTRPSSKKDKKQYTVVPGDTLWGISLKFYGKGSDWPKVYKANKDTIEKAARARGLAGSSNGWWIFAGTSLKIPS